MNILIPMAGLGSRFANAGYERPKPLIEFLGKTMIEHALDTLGIEGDHIFCLHQDHCREYGLDRILKKMYPNCKIKTVDYLTEGAACTCMLAREYIDNEDELIVANCDQYMRWDAGKFREFLSGMDADAALVTFKSDSPGNSYARLDEEGYVDLVREKEVISRYALNGIHYWRRGKDFCQSFDEMVAADDRTKGEFYVAPSYNYLISRGIKVKVYDIHPSHHCSTGTPEDLDRLLSELI